MNGYLDKLSNMLEDEIQDCHNYYNMAKETSGSKRCPDNDTSMQLYLIAEDEFTHARFIFNELSAHGIAIHDDIVAKYCELETMAKEAFPTAVSVANISFKK